jgi:acetyl-CoA carboxylase biotin carboxyl carrier protein
MPLTDDDIREILRIIDESQLEELKIETGGFSLHVTKSPTGGRSVSPGPSAARGAGETDPPPAAPPGTPKLGEKRGEAQANGLVTIEAPLLGTFYRAEGPGKTPFVEVGTEVEPDSIVCIIEVMKMMNSVPAGVSGTIVEVCSDNAQMVEYGAPLFRVQPA